MLTHSSTETAVSDNLSILCRSLEKFTSLGDSHKAALAPLPETDPRVRINNNTLRFVSHAYCFIARGRLFGIFPKLYVSYGYYSLYVPFNVPYEQWIYCRKHYTDRYNITHSYPLAFTRVTAWAQSFNDTRVLFIYAVENDKYV